jgi:8-oxo-dGTP pyrophosphatase MutT (NUDIX family)
MRSQVGALPYRFVDGRLEFLLVTSASRGRWIIPKGNIEPHLGPVESARIEALEEGGVTGRISHAPLGSFVNSRQEDSTVVTVYPLRVENMIQDDRWVERQVRKRAWFAPQDAVREVEEADLRVLLNMAEELLS